MAVPVALVVTVIEPDVPEPEPVAPLHVTDAELAPEVDQLNVAEAPTTTELALKAALVTEAAATTDMLSEPVAVVPAALVAVTLHVVVPAFPVATVMLPDAPEPVAVAPPPVHATVVELAPDVAQL